jgi:hypothetical protein
VTLQASKGGQIMENILLELGAANGLWATLFVCLFLYTLYDSRKREKEYQGIIGKLSDTINVDLHSVKEDIREIKNKI